MVTPSVLLIWRPGEVERFFGTDPSVTCPGFAGTIANTRVGERAWIYQTASDQGLVAYFDFTSDAFPMRDLGYAAWGAGRLLRTAVGRDALLATNPGTFTRPRGRQRIPEARRDELAALTSLPARPLAAPGLEFSPAEAQHLTWVPAGNEDRWGYEAAMQQAIAEHPPSYRKLGFREPPRLEVRPGPGLDRTDLYGPGVIAECKLDASTAALAQLRRYLDAAAAREPHHDWRGHLVAGRSVSTEAIRAAKRIPDIVIWRCTRAGPRPRLSRIA